MYCDNILCVLCECMTLSVVEFDLYFRSFERSIPIWLIKIVSKKDQSASQFLSDKKKWFSLANTHSIMDVIAISSEINHENIASHANFFMQHLSGLSSRLEEIYSVYRLISHVVSHISYTVS